jgi:hypothetical protein
MKRRSPRHDVLRSRLARSRQLQLETLEDRRLLATFPVENTSDSDAGSLRWAIEQANQSPNVLEPDVIAFNIPTGDVGYDSTTGAFTIQPLSALPDIIDPVIIDGYSQLDASPNTQAVGDDAVLKIELDGSLAGSASGLVIAASSSTVRGLVINRFAGSGIDITGDDNVIVGNFIGTNVTGTVDKPVGVANNGFEFPNLGGSYQYGLTSGTWTFVGYTGITANNTAWGVTDADNGNSTGVTSTAGQTAFIQLGNGLTSGSAFYQSLSVEMDKTLFFTFSLQGRAGFGVNPIKVMLDDQDLGTYTPASDSSFNTVTTPAVAATAGTHVLYFIGTNPNGDTGSFVDNVWMESATPSLTPGAVALYKAEDDKAEDSAGDAINGLNGTLSGTATFAAGEFGQAFSFDGSTNCAVALLNTATGPLDITGSAITIEAWVNQTDPTQSGSSLNAQTILGKGYDTSGNISYLLQTVGGYLTLSLVTSTGRTDLAASATLPLNTWVQVVGTYDGTTMRLYQNGVQVAAVGKTGSLTHTDVDARIGNLDGGDGWKGRLDEVAVYNRALTPAEIQNGHSPGNAGMGISIAAGATSNRIGIDGGALNALTDRNVIAGNGGIGIFIADQGTEGNVVAGNYIGTDATGFAALGNQLGVQIAWGASHNLIGTNDDGQGDDLERNIISGNRDGGIFIFGDINTTAATGNVVAGNYIGTTADGASALGNAANFSYYGGLAIMGKSTGNFVGTNSFGQADAATRNIISGNFGNGIVIEGWGWGANDNVVANNLIGTDVTGTMAIPNLWRGICIEESAGYNRIGTDGDGVNDAGERNIIAANGQDGIYIGGIGADGNVVAGNFIGTDVTGAIALGNGGNGVTINWYPNHNRIGTDGNGGGDDAAEGNVISGNNVGVFITNAVSETVVAGNYIGTNAAGTAALPNRAFGVGINGGSHSNRIGTDGNGIEDEAERNIISGNGYDGIGIWEPGTDNNIVAGNFIGTDVTGTTAISNGYHGVEIGWGAKSNRIGTDGTSPNAAAQGNLISGNNGDGVGILGAGADNNVVAGNYIGTDFTGTAVIGNALHGVQIADGRNNRVGTDGNGVDDAVERNIISGNGDDGVRIQGAGQPERIASNVLFAPPADAGSALRFDGAGDYVEIPDSDTLHSDRQLTVAGWFLVESFDKAWQNIFWKGNTPDYTVGAENREYGLWVNSTGFLYFSSTPESRIGVGELLAITEAEKVTSGQWYHFAAVIDANAGFMQIYLDGELAVESPYDPSGIRDTTGPLRFGNNPSWDDSFHGSLDEMSVWNAALSPTQIQALMQGPLTGSEPDLLAAWNFDGSGSQVVDDLTLNGNNGRLSGTASNRIQGNSIFNNVGLGINLGDDGVTANDLGDTDVGPNYLQNFPVLTAAQGGPTTRVRGTVNSTPNTTLTLDFYANQEVDLSSYGEGQRYLGWAEVTTDSSGNASFDLALDGESADSEFITATATDPDGNTSEFSVAVATPSNQAPAASDNTVTTDEDTPLAFVLAGSDVENDPLTYSVVTGPAHGILSGTAPNVTYTPAADFNGSDSFTYKVNDGQSDSNVAMVTVTVNPVNDAPVLASIGAQTVNAQAMLSFTATATDQDLPAQTLSFSLDASSLTAGMTIDPARGVFSWTPSELQGGTTYTVTVKVTDNGTNPQNLFDSETFTITVLSAVQQLEIVQATVQDLADAGVLNGGNANALISKLDSAIKKLNTGKTNAAVNQLNAFLNQVRAFIKTGKLTFDQGQLLIDAVNLVILAASTRGSALVSNISGGGTTSVEHAQPVADAGELLVETVGVSFVNPSGAAAAEQHARFQDALSTLNQTFSLYGVQLVEVDPQHITEAILHVEIAASSPFGGTAEGVLGYAAAGQVILVSGWDWYLGTAPDATDADQYDFQTIVTHELGHSIGLSHSGDLNSVMYDLLASGETHRDVTAQDLTLLRDGGGEPAALRAVPRPGIIAQMTSASIISEGTKEGFVPQFSYDCPPIWANVLAVPTFVTAAERSDENGSVRRSERYYVREVVTGQSMDLPTCRTAVNAVFADWGADWKYDVRPKTWAKNTELRPLKDRNIEATVDQLFADLVSDPSCDREF